LPNTCTFCFGGCANRPSRYDTYAEEELQHWQDALHNSIALRLNTVGHFVAEEAPREFGDAVAAFLAGGDFSKTLSKLRRCPYLLACS
jgi:hypothetical protein